ncbi:hypothetical protein ABR855_12240 [Aeromonas hydrophila]|uniref:hypothetical protein n=1 Tax=Aeromonas hydrophila TaxID=644 RepID=UPI003306501B
MKTKLVHEFDKEECLIELSEIFFNSQKTKEPQNQEAKAAKDPQDRLIARYTELAQKAAEVIKRVEELNKQVKIDSAKKILEGLSQEEILKALGIEIPVKAPRSSKVDVSKEPAAKIHIWYMNEHSQPDQVEIGIKGPTPSENVALKAFLTYAKDTKSKTRKDLDTAKMTVEEFRETFKGYQYTA